MQLRRANLLKTDTAPPDVCILHLPPDRIDFPPLKAGLLAARLNCSGLVTTVFDVNVHLRRDTNQKQQSFWQPVNEHYWHDKNQLVEFFQDNADLVENLVHAIAGIGATFIVVDLTFPTELFFAELLQKIKKVQPEIEVIVAGPIH